MKAPYRETFQAGFINGIAYSAATLISICHEGAAEQLINESGLSWGDLRKAGIDSHDRTQLIKIKHKFSGEKQ